ncbi:MAG: hypothetical protein ACRD0P_30650, partial [Stackebrandtia sp.]
RKELARQMEQKRLRPLVKIASICGGVAASCLVVTLIAGLLGFAVVAYGALAPAGAAVLVMTGTLLAIEFKKARKRDRMKVMGWVGMVLAVFSGGSLIATSALFLLGVSEEPRAAIGVAVFTTVMGIGCLGTDMTKNIKGGNTNNNASETLNDVTDILN